MTILERLKQVLKEEPELAILLAEIISAPPSISALPRPWER